MRRRDRLETVYTILCIIRDKGPIKRTPLLRSANLCGSSYKEYYTELTSKHFISEEEINGKIHLVLSDKGFRFLEKYAIINSFIKEFNLG